MREERFKVSFSVSLMWQEKSGEISRLAGRCVDLSSEGISVEVKDRVSPGVVVQVESKEFGRMGHAIVRFCRRDQMRYVIGCKFSAPFGISDPARRKILERVLLPADSVDDTAGQKGYRAATERER
jgi:hypothetical protein